MRIFSILRQNGCRTGNCVKFNNAGDEQQARGRA
jgi:hypothetical protein